MLSERGKNGMIYTEIGGVDAKDPEKIWKMRQAFSDFQQSFPEEFKAELLKQSAAMLGVFLDLLCEAVFDDEKRKGQEAGK